MAVAIYVTGISTPEVHPESPPLLGTLTRVVGRLFEGEEAVLHVIERIVAPLGLRVDATSPWVDARLPDGSRVHAIVPPLSLCGPVLNVRKFSSIPLARVGRYKTES